MTSEQKAAVKQQLKSMGLDESAMMYEFGLSERDPFAADRTVGTCKPLARAQRMGSLLGAMK